MAVFISHKKEKNLPSASNCEIKKVFFQATHENHQTESLSDIKKNHRSIKASYLIGTCLTRPHEVFDRFGFKMGIFIFMDSSGGHHLIYCASYLVKLLDKYSSNKQKVKVILSQSKLNKSTQQVHLRASNFVLL